MYRNLVVAILIVALCGHLCFCRRAGSIKRGKKVSSNSSNTKPPAPTKAPTIKKNLCYGGLMINDTDLEPSDKEFYQNNWKDFPDGLYYPGCSRFSQANISKNVLIERCVNFTMRSSKLDLPYGKDAAEPKDRVMFLLIYQLCSSESCGQPCLPESASSTTRNLCCFTQLLPLIISLLACLVLPAE